MDNWCGGNTNLFISYSVLNLFWHELVIGVITNVHKVKKSFDKFFLFLFQKTLG